MNSSLRAALSRLPPCASTGIGSLPLRDPRAALEHAFSLDVPYLPELPAGAPGELMIPAGLEGIPGVRVESSGACTVALAQFEEGQGALRRALSAAEAREALEAWLPTPASRRCWAPFLAELERRRAPFAKVQLAAPEVLRGALGATSPELSLAIGQVVRARALAMVRAVQGTGASPIVFLDGPGLPGIPEAEPDRSRVLGELVSLIAVLQKAGAVVGLHCCGNIDWSPMLGLGLDLLSIDARLSLDAVLEDASAFQGFLARGGALSLGVIPTNIGATFVLEELVGSIEASLRATALPGMPFEAMLSRVLVTPACGLALHPEDSVPRIFSALQEAQRQLRALLNGWRPLARARGERPTRR